MVLSCREKKKSTTSSWRLGWRTGWMEIDLDEKFYDRLREVFLKIAVPLEL
jgi:hypothetical protein